MAHTTLSANSINEDDAEADFQLASSLPLPAPVTQVVAIPRGSSDSQPQPTSQSENGDQQQNFDDFHDQFLNNHISTIEEDFEGENMTSEFSTQRTNAKDLPGGSDRGRAGNHPGGSGSASGSVSQKGETPLPRDLDDINGNQAQQHPVDSSLAVTILNSEPVRRFHLPESSSEKCTPARNYAEQEEQDNLQSQINMISKQTPKQRRGQANFLEVDPQVVDFGTIFISQASVRTVEIRSSRLRDVTVCSQLVGVVFFADGRQQIDLADSMPAEGATHLKVDVYFRPDRPGK